MLMHSFLGLCTYPEYTLTCHEYICTHTHTYTHTHTHTQSHTFERAFVFDHCRTFKLT